MLSAKGENITLILVQIRTIKSAVKFHSKLPGNIYGLPEGKCNYNSSNCYFSELQAGIKKRKYNDPLKWTEQYTIEAIESISAYRSKLRS